MLLSPSSVLLCDQLLGCLLDALLLDDALRRDDVSDAWMVWSGAAETALADAFCFAGGPVLDRGLVLGRGAAQIQGGQTW